MGIVGLSWGGCGKKEVGGRGGGAGNRRGFLNPNRIQSPLHLNSSFFHGSSSHPHFSSSLIINNNIFCSTKEHFELRGDSSKQDPIDHLFTFILRFFHGAGSHPHLSSSLINNK